MCQCDSTVAVVCGQCHMFTFSNTGHSHSFSFAVLSVQDGVMLPLLRGREPRELIEKQYKAKRMSLSLPLSFAV